MDRVLIAGTHSGCGKTTATAGLLCALKKRGLKVSAFKCGPDYIDPMFHREAIGLPSYNLAPFFLDEVRLRQHLRAHAGEISVIEGAMEYYDGIGPEGHAGTYSVAGATHSPAILVLNARGMRASAGAVISGFCGSADEGCGFTAKKAGRDMEYPCVHTNSALYAGFPHLYRKRWRAAGTHLRKYPWRHTREIHDGAYF